MRRFRRWSSHAPPPLLTFALAWSLQTVHGVREDADNDEGLSGVCPAGSQGDSCRGAQQQQGGVQDAYKGNGGTLQCREWALRCECSANPGFMLKECKKSCQDYGQNCKDRAPGCDEEVKTHCSDEQWKRCPKTCSEVQARLTRHRGQNKDCKRIEVPGGLQDRSIPEMFGRIADEGWAAEHKPKVLSRDPWVVYFDELLTHKQVDDLLLALMEAGGQFAESDELSTVKSEARKRRTSDSLFCNQEQCMTDPRVLAAHSVVSNITGLPLPAHELLQVTRYKAGQYYVKHQDTSDDYGRSAAGHRIYTMFLYFTDLPDDAGGETGFPALGITVKPKKGAAVLWHNVKADNPRREEHRCDHEGKAVKEVQWPDGRIATKIGGNMWLYGYEWRHNWAKGCMNVAAGY
eukprot:TRINITY_DN103646_c0_g1_i1.p1 TRINITY_DN103646_c0_g1~~TRINITY_DN103646_c0_g1_i1.p1  ORF type:complete len:404 (-),score=80.26 TRINITY_DN103646_c0_g1_i1:393-1604(-)